MQGVPAATGAVFFHLNAPGLVAAILVRKIVAFFAFGAGQSNQHAISFFSHCVTYLFFRIKVTLGLPTDFCYNHKPRRLEGNETTKIFLYFPSCRRGFVFFVV